MIFGDEDSWNVRDRHMVDALDSALGTAYPQGKVIIWAHNTHIGDYRYTSMKDEGQVNIGGLVREKYGKENVALVGFGTFKGSVIASNSWGGEVKKLQVPSARKGSYDELFHQYCQELKSEGCWVIFDHLEEEKKKGIFENARTKGHWSGVPSGVSVVWKLCADGVGEEV